MRRRYAPRRGPTTSCGPSRAAGRRCVAPSPAGHGGPATGWRSRPMFEDARLFRRGIGSQSDVVSKEMYEFTDRDERPLALRPEGTAPVVRAFVQHHPPVPWKAWYVTPAFRYERPQAGRYRQHHQLGVEVLGTEDPDLDVEVIALAAGFYGELGCGRSIWPSTHGLRRRPARLLEALLGVSGRARRRAVRRAPGALLGEPAAGARLQEAASAGPSPRAPRTWSTTSTRACAAHFARVRAGTRRPRHRPPARAPSRAGPRLLHPHDLRVRRPGAGVGPERGGRGRPLRRSGRGHRRASRPRGSGSASASSGCCWPATPKAASPSTRPAADAFVGRPDRRRAGPGPGRRAAPGRAARPAGLRRPLAQGAAQAGGPIRRPGGAHHRSRGARLRRGDARPCGRRASRRRWPATRSWPGCRG